MNFYLNTSSCFNNFNELLNNKYFVDKSNIIENLNERIGTNQKYICITRPRRFGKSSIINMLGSYYSKNNNSKEIFGKLNISKCETYENNLNKHNIIKIDFSELPSECCSYEEYIGRIKINLENDLKHTYTNIDFKNITSLSDKFTKTNDKFIFILDEWDYIFNKDIFTKNHNDFLEFLRNLLKDKSYVLLCYMTGILPIKRYSTGSALNMFEEFTFLKDKVFDEYFGFTEKEVKYLCKKNNNLDYKDLEGWYNGYTTAKGTKIYNPRSVVLALYNNSCESYWTSTGAMNEVLDYLKYDIYGIREDVIKMLNFEEVEIEIKNEYRAGQNPPQTISEIYSAMVILGFLSYFDGIIKIPNKELMKEFEEAVKDESFGEVSRIVNNSKKMLKATQTEDTETIVNILHDIHNSEIPILKYNDENSLSCVVTLAYLYARDTYRIEREEKSGKGYVDFCFHPRRNRDLPIILELKKDEDVLVAINQIKDKEYAVKFKKEYKNRDILIVAICYNSKSKEHCCKIEKI